MTAETALLPTAGQTIGPFFGYALPYDDGPLVVAPFHPRAIRLSGHVYDGAGDPVPDAMVEIWQPDEDGRIPTEHGSLHRDGHTFTGFGRSATTDEGIYQFWTLTPGAMPPRNGSGTPAPFISAILFARGLTDKLHTRIYLPDSQEVLAADPLLSTLTEKQRASLIAVREPDGSLHHDFHLQGDSETVFLDFG